MLVLHANWTRGDLWLWGELLETFLSRSRHSCATDDERHRSPGAPDAGQGVLSSDVATAVAADHLFAATCEALATEIHAHGGPEVEPASPSRPLHLHLPCDDAGPLPSDRLASLVGTIERPIEPWLGLVAVPAVRMAGADALASILKLEALGTNATLDCSHSVRYWIEVGRFVTDLLADQRFIPTLFRARGDTLRAAWQPWIHDDASRARVGALLSSMPPIVRAVPDVHRAEPWAILDEALRRMTDRSVRRVLHDEAFAEALEDRDASSDPHVAWLAGLLTDDNGVTPPGGLGTEMLRDARRWVGRLDDTGHDQPLHLCLALGEPEDAGDDTGAWSLRLSLQSTEGDERVEAPQIWSPAGSTQRIGAGRIDRLQELLLSEIARAGHVYHKLETALSDATPTGIELTTTEAYEFLTEHKPLLEESGFIVLVPEWWSKPAGTLGARLRLEAPPLDGSAGEGRRELGLGALVKYEWEVAVGDEQLSREEFEALVRRTEPLVRVRNRWVEVRPREVRMAESFFNEPLGGEMALSEAIGLAYGGEAAPFGLPILGMRATGWVRDLLHATDESVTLPQHPQPDGFVGTLRPYQVTGLNWLSFLDQFGLGACLADDMGLGKTIQLIALLLHERQYAAAPDTIGPTLLIVPTSLISNWSRELERFAPSLRSFVHHGPARRVGEDFAAGIEGNDVVITTYGLVSRDVESLGGIDWHRIVLDEAQYIKNPPTKQTRAIRSLRTQRRLTLTGTPVENRLSELWSIMEFCNPGYLGPAADFRRRLAVPIERHRDRTAADRLRQIVRPFVLRRLKTDPTVIDDLPDCLETKEFATLTAEQAALYENVVKSMLGQVEQADGMQRRGLVLSTLVKLKQICNHPAQFLAEPDQPTGADEAGRHLLSRRSGKTQRLLVLLEEVVASGERALIFTQFRRMGHLLQAVIEHDLDAESLFLHGGTPQRKRQQLIDRFQDPDGAISIFVLSLRAGGVGLNLTAANHVFHFDRWWNPAVENQATDRAFRIGQQRTVHVHKFVCLGTLEERIDAMIEQKMELADNIIGSGEDWVTEMSTKQLRELLALRDSAMESDR